MFVEGEQRRNQKGLRSDLIVPQIDLDEVGGGQRLEQLEAIQNGNRALVASVEQALGRSDRLVDGERRAEIVACKRMATILTQYSSVQDGILQEHRYGWRQYIGKCIVVVALQCIFGEHRPHIEVGRHMTQDTLENRFRFRVLPLAAILIGCRMEEGKNRPKIKVNITLQQAIALMDERWNPNTLQKSDCFRAIGYDRQRISRNFG